MPGGQCSTVFMMEDVGLNCSIPHPGEESTLALSQQGSPTGLKEAELLVKGFDRKNLSLWSSVRSGI